MEFLKKIFGSEDLKSLTYDDFWTWFAKNEAAFHKVIQTKDSQVVKEKFFSKLEPKLSELKDGIFYLVGMLDDSTAELVLTADGNPKNIAFIEELVNAAPSIHSWQFTSLKQPDDRCYLTMNGFEYGFNTLSFYSNDHSEMPDLIDITIVHKDYNEESADSIKRGAYIFLDNYLGELRFLTEIDEIRFCAAEDAKKKLIPIEALSNFLETQQALFVEKYDGVRIFTENDSYSTMEAQLASGNRCVAMVNADLISWDKKASHPWMLVVTIQFDKTLNRGLPDDSTAEKLNEIEDVIDAELKDVDGYLYIGRQAANGERTIFYACSEFRKPSKVAYDCQVLFSDSFPFEYEIFKDKYWQSVSHLMPKD